MILLLLAFAAGVLTVLSPCVLPVLPFVFARPGSGRVFGGMAVGFGAVMLLATTGGAWAIEVHGGGRALALVLLALFGLALAWPQAVTRRVAGPAGRLAAAFATKADAAPGGRRADWLLGLSTGLLWAPCAGPVLGLVLTSAALGGGGLDSAAPLLAYATGAAAMLALVRRGIARAGQWLPSSWRSLLPAAERGRRLSGALVLAGVLVIALGLDARLAVALPGLGLDRLGQRWVDQWHPSPSSDPRQASPVSGPPARQASAVLRATGAQASSFDLRRMALGDGPPPVALPDLGAMPPLAGASAWLQSPPLQADALRGKVVLVDFWTFGCINCQRALPSVREWARRYRDQGLVVIGVHTPEFAYERDRGNVERALGRMGLDFAIAMDNEMTIWRAWSNRYWPALYLVDARGRVRWRHFGEGAYAETEQAIRQLIDEAKRSRPTT